MSARTLLRLGSRREDGRCVKQRESSVASCPGDEKCTKCTNSKNVRVGAATTNSRHADAYATERPRAVKKVVHGSRGFKMCRNVPVLRNARWNRRDKQRPGRRLREASSYVRSEGAYLENRNAGCRLLRRLEILDYLFPTEWNSFRQFPGVSYGKS